MGRPVHTVNLGAGSTGFNRQDSLTIVNIAQLAYPAGNGDPSAVAAGSPGVGYATIPTVAFVNAGSGSGATVTALMGVVANPTVAAAGTGGTNGAVTLTGTTGTGTKFQVTGVIAGGVLASITAITVAGSYSALPTTLAAEPVTGGSLTGCTLNLSGAMGVIGYTVAGSSNHQYPNGTTAVLTGGTPSTAAIPGAVAITSVAGQGAKVVLGNLSLPAAYAVLPGDIGQSGDCYISGRSTAGFTVNIAPGASTQTLTAGAVDLVVVH